MPNNRIYWPILGVALAPQDSTAYKVIHGLQSVGITTTFNLEQVFELGQLAIYENIENIPDVEVTMEKVIDGYSLIYHLATRGFATNTLAGRQNQRCNFFMAIYGDTQNSASGVQIAEVICSGMYLSSASYTFPVDGNCTESVTLVGNNKLWKSAGYVLSGTLFDNNDVPLAQSSGLGGIQRRDNVLFDVTAIATPNGTLLPGGTNGIPGISSSGTNNKTNGVYGAHVQGITVSMDLGRDSLNELGRKGPYYRFANFPVEVSCDIEVLDIGGDQISATETGVLGSGNNLPDNSKIYIKLQDSTTVDLGSKAKLSNVSFGGADAGGGNATTTYSYVTYNDFIVTHNQDPA